MVHKVIRPWLFTDNLVAMETIVTAPLINLKIMFKSSL